MDVVKRIWRGYLSKLPILKDGGPWRSTLSRLVVLAFFWVACAYVMSVMVVVAGLRYPKFGISLPDIGFDLFTAHIEYEWVANFLVGFCAFASLVRCLFCSEGLTVIRRFVFVHGCCMLMRASVVAATSYPDPSPWCEPSEFFEPPKDVNPFFAAALGNKDLITCGDLMWSGHTLFYFGLGLGWSRYFYLLESIAFWCVSITAMLVLIITRLHYLTDIIVAIYIFAFAWHTYHLYATSPTLIKRSSIIAWLESDIYARTRLADANKRRAARAPDEVEGGSVIALHDDGDHHDDDTSEEEEEHVESTSSQ